MSFPGEPEIGIAILQIRIDGHWTVEEFAEILRKVESTYDGLNTIYFFAYALRLEALRNSRAHESRDFSEDSTVRNLWHGTEAHYFLNKITPDEVFEKAGPPIQSLVPVVRELSGRLILASVSYGSPGWIEMLGSLNPLKVIADVIKDWREQNTTRMQNELHAETERQKNRLHAETEQRRIQGYVLKAVLSSSPELWRENNGRLTEASEKLLRPAMKAIEEIARDIRITDVLLKGSDEKSQPPR